MPDYKNGKVYKIVSPSHPELVYYGSTVQKLNVRMGGHRHRPDATSKLILCYDDAIIVLVESVPCNTKEELTKKEAEYILQNKCVNKRVPLQKTKDEKALYEKTYRIDNDEKIKVRRKANYNDNREKELERAKTYKLNHQEENKEYQRQYRANNPEYMKEYMRAYRKKQVNI